MVPDIVTYNAMCDAWAREGRLSAVEALVTSASLAGFQPDRNRHANPTHALISVRDSS